MSGNRKSAAALHQPISFSCFLTLIHAVVVHVPAATAFPAVVASMRVNHQLVLPEDLMNAVPEQFRPLGKIQLQYQVEHTILCA